MAQNPNQFDSNLRSMAEVNREFAAIMELGEGAIEAMQRHDRIRRLTAQGNVPGFNQSVDKPDDDNPGSGRNPREWRDGPLSHGPTGNNSSFSPGELIAA